MNDRWLSTGAACKAWGGGICHRSMQKLISKWYDCGYGIGEIDVTDGGHWRVRESFLRLMKERRVKQA